LPSQKMPVDARLDEIVLRALAKEPEQRYQRISELKMDVATITTPCHRETPAEPAALVVAKPRKPKAGVLGKVQSFFNSVRYYIVDRVADQRSAPQLTNSSPEKPRIRESPPRSDQAPPAKTDPRTQRSASKEVPNVWRETPGRLKSFFGKATGWAIIFCLLGI